MCRQRAKGQRIPDHPGSGFGERRKEPGQRVDVLSGQPRFHQFFAAFGGIRLGCGNQQRAGPGAMAKGGLFRSGKILVIDDDAAICTAIRRTLGRRHQVTTTTSGREAIDRIKGGERYDLILCDLMMPMVTGMEVHAELTEAAPEQASRLVFLTGGAFTTEAREFLKRIPNERFEKPFDGGRLRMLAKEMVDDAKPPPK